MENENENNIPKYNSILQKINHKPLIVEYIFSFLKDKPYKFLNLIEKDHILKSTLNSSFNKVLKGNTLPKEFKDNIYLIQLYKKVQNFCFNQQNIIENNVKYSTEFEKYIIKNPIDPSFIEYKSKCIYTEMLKYNQNDISKIKPSISSFTDIIFYEIGKYNHFILVYLPSKNNNYLDGIFIEQFLKNDSIKKEIDILYCIIDDNQYFYNDDLNIINKDIIINNLYFIYLKGIKDINIYKAIKKYLSLLNTKNIKKITLGGGILEILNNEVITENKFKFPNGILINFNFDNFQGDITKLYLKLFKLFKNQKIEGLDVIDNQSLDDDIMDKLQNSKNKTLLFKIKNISDINSIIPKENMKKFRELEFHRIIFYIDKIIKQENSKKINENSIDIQLFKKYHFIPEYAYFKYLRSSILIYSEAPYEKIEYKNNFDSSIEITDCNDNLIMFEYNSSLTNSYLVISNLLLLKKYDDLCIKFYYNDKIYFKIYFIKSNTYHNILLIYKGEKVDLIQKDKYTPLLDFQLLIDYCKKELNLKIHDIKYIPLPFEWTPNLNNKIKEDKENKENNKTKIKLGKKGFASKINQKKILENEMEDELYEEEEENEEEYFSDNY